MTLQEFVNTYNGLSVGSGQCVALIKQYQVDVLGTSAPAVGNAKDYWENYENTPFLVQTYEKIPLSSGGQVGDVCVWNGNVGHGYGHIDVVIGDITSSGFTGFDQNWNTPLHCAIESHNYNNVYGFLRPRGGTPPTPPEPPTPTPTGNVILRNSSYGDYYGTTEGMTASLNQSQQKLNAKYIWKSLEAKEWTLEASSIFIGASSLISTLNGGFRPRLDRDSPFGLLGWRYWEFEDWVIEGGMYVYSSDLTEIENSIGRIEWYKDFDLAWNDIDVNFIEFSQKEESIDKMVQYWVDNYAYNQLSYNDLLQASKKWYKYLKGEKNNWKYLYLT